MNMNTNLIRTIVESRMKAGDQGVPSIPSYAYRGSDKRIPSKDTGIGNATLAPIKEYTGTKMLGISTMHKSNAVPVFSKEEAESISKMK